MVNACCHTSSRYLTHHQVGKVYKTRSENLAKTCEDQYVRIYSEQVRNLLVNPDSLTNEDSLHERMCSVFLNTEQTKQEA